MLNPKKYSYHKDGTLPNFTDNYIFVFGSNLLGAHGRGAALVAKEQYGAKCGTNMGITGDSYAIPTKNRYIKIMALTDIVPHIELFKSYTHTRPDLKFWVTSIGCGLAGYSINQIAPYFKDSNTNCNFPDTWIPYLEVINS